MDADDPRAESEKLQDIFQACYFGCLKGPDSLKGSFEGDIGVDIDAEVEVDLDRCFGCLKRV